MMKFIDILTAVLVLLGAAAGLLAAIGLVRMPDLYMRMQSATKAATLGVAFVALATAVHFGYTSASIAVEAIIIIGFFFLTGPIASHLIGRAAYTGRVPLWSRTVRDDMAEHRPAPPPGSPEPTQPD